MPDEESNQTKEAKRRATWAASGKRRRRTPIASGAQRIFSSQQISQVQATQPPTPRSLCLTDLSSGLDFLVDSGADVSVFPIEEHKGSVAQRPNTSSLHAANGTSIPTFGKAAISLHFRGLTTVHEFFLADVPRPILGADFFSRHDLLIDIKSQRLLRCPPGDSALLAPLVPVQARATLLLEMSVASGRRLPILSKIYSGSSPGYRSPASIRIHLPRMGLATLSPPQAPQSSPAPDALWAIS